MTTNTNALSVNRTSSHSSSNFSSLFKNHGELIAALISGLIILTAWIIKTNIPYGFFVTLNIIAFTIGGYAKAKEGITETLTDKKLNVELLMVFAAIGSATIGYWTEGAILIFIFALSGALETYTLNRSNKEISSLMKLQPEEALRINENGEKIVPVSELMPKDIILVKAGERIPADGKIIKGLTSVDESAITGESIPVTKEKSHEVFAGTVALDGTIKVEITKRANETLFQKIIQMVQQAKDEKSTTQLFIERFEGSYVNIVIITVLIMMFLPYFLFGWTLTESIYRAMVLLVVASPCALVASIMPATLSAISNSARKGVLFKGGVHIENLINMKAVAFDKTGTLTYGKPVVTDAFFASNYEKENVISIAGAIENESTHPLALAITAYSKKYGDQKTYEVEQMKTISGIGVSAIVENEKWEIGKPSLIGEHIAYQFQDGIAKKLANEGKTVVFIIHNNQVAGLFALKDTIRKEAKKAVQALQNRGIYTIMLTGDNEPTAKAIAKEAGINHYIAECLPNQKVKELKKLKDSFKDVAMVGDGINDAPALATANIGVAMGEGTDVALETADIVLMKNDLSKINETMGLSKRMNQIIKQNIFFSIAVIVILIISNFFQAIDLPLGVIGHEGSTILVILNGLRLLR